MHFTLTVQIIMFMCHLKRSRCIAIQSNNVIPLSRRFPPEYANHSHLQLDQSETEIVNRF